MPSKINKILAAAALAAGGVVFWKLLTTPGRAASTSLVEASIEVEASVSAAYQQWARFDEYPKFMVGVHEVHQLDDTHVQWRAEVGGQEKQWNAEIVEQIPYMRIAWRSISGVRREGIVTFQKVSETRTNVVLKTHSDAFFLDGQASDTASAGRLWANSTLNNFKQLLERTEQRSVF